VKQGGTMKELREEFICLDCGCKFLVIEGDNFQCPKCNFHRRAIK